MKARVLWGTIGTLASAVSVCSAEPGEALRALPAPVVVELFQSQGCSDCPPAQENLNRLADRPDVLALSYGVTYWDYLGWKDSPSAGPSLSVTGSSLSVGSGMAPSGGADIWLVRYDPRTLQVAIRSGENSGRTIPHRDIVRELIRLGRWSGRAQTLTLPASVANGLRGAVLVQAGGGGPILAAAKIHEPQ